MSLKINEKPSIGSSVGVVLNNGNLVITMTVQGYHNENIIARLNDSVLYELNDSVLYELKLQKFIFENDNIQYWWVPV